MTAFNGATKPHDIRQMMDKELLAVSLLDALCQDERPSFVVRTSISHAQNSGLLQVIYSNPALLAVDALLSKVSGQEDAKSVFAESSSAHLAFRAWLDGKVQAFDSCKRGKAYLYEGFLWSAVSLGEYTIVSGMPSLLFWTDAVPRRRHPTPEYTKSKQPTLSDKIIRPIRPPLSQTLGPKIYLKHGPFDHTRERCLSTDPHITYFRSVDWSATPLGPMESWTDELRSTVNLTLNSGYPTVLFYGEDRNMVYNHQYIQVVGSLHPCMGKSIKDMAPEHWPAFEPLISHINKTGLSLTEGDMPLFIDRHGSSEETHWSFQLAPVLDNSGHIIAYYHTLVETTDLHLLKRRVTSLVEVGGQTSKARDFESFWNAALEALALNDKDLPFALLYGPEGSPRAEMSSVSSPGSIQTLEKCLLKGAIGVEAGNLIAPSTFDMSDESYILHPFLTQATRTRKATIVHISELPLTETALRGIQWKGYGEPCQLLIVCPILPTSGEQVEGFLILGMNPRRPFDNDYRQYIQVLLRLFASSYASVVLFDEEIRRRELAIGQAARIQEQLLAEIQHKEKKFQRFIERCDVAVFGLNPLGEFTFRNDRWYELFPVAATGSNVQTAWEAIVFPEDVEFCEGIFKKLVVDHENISIELKTKIPWTPPTDGTQPESEGITYYRYILCSAYPELDAENQLIEAIGNVTDISRQKWAQGRQQLRAQMALESKQHLEHYIDSSSHEIRNPLSCILQCADGILCSALPPSDEPPSPTSWTHFMDQTLDAAQTIVDCAQHMRRLVDDILMVSKLNSGLLVVTPIDASPEKLVSHAVKMFEAEAKAAKVDLSFVIEKSYRDMAVTYARIDPTRTLQVLINLLTNAIKFTRREPVRHVIVTLSASAKEPMSLPGGIQFNEDRLVAEDQNLQEDLKSDPDLFYVQFSVKDTGRGLTAEEISHLFARFSQASPRTHINYGGSGLGLFISRRLTELQGGAIGLKSEPKRGSVFSFYIKTRHTQMNTQTMDVLQSPENIRHRPDTGIVSLCQPPESAQKTASGNTEQLKVSKPPLKRPLTLQRSISVAHPTLPPEVLGLPDPTAQGPKVGVIPDPMHVLIVEDNLVNQRVLSKQLRNLGCVVHVANHGLEALEFLPKTTCWNRGQTATSPRPSHAPVYHIPSTEPLPDSHVGLPPIELHVILMDWEMPVMDGLTAIVKIRELESEGVMRKSIPVLMVTANVREQQVQRALEAGCNAIVSKPFKIQELLVRIKDVFGSMEK